MNNKLKKKTIESTHGGDWTVLIIFYNFNLSQRN